MAYYKYVFNTHKKGSKRGREKQKRHRHSENKQQMAYINPIPSIIKLQVNGLNTSIKRQSQSAWIKK